MEAGLTEFDWLRMDRGAKAGVPNGIRTRVLALKGPRPRPLDDGDRREPRAAKHLNTRMNGRLSNADIITE